MEEVNFHESCKCDCLLNETVCNDKQKWDENNCKCGCLKIKKCDIGFSWNFNNCKCEESEKAAKLTTEEECKEIIDDLPQNKTISITKQVENCKPFVASSILFVSVSMILTGIMIYFYVKTRNNDILP